MLRYKHFVTFCVLKYLHYMSQGHCLHEVIEDTVSIGNAGQMNYVSQLLKQSHVQFIWSTVELGIFVLIAHEDSGSCTLCMTWRAMMIIECCNNTHRGHHVPACKRYVHTLQCWPAQCHTICTNYARGIENCNR